MTVTPTATATVVYAGRRIGRDGTLVRVLVDPDTHTVVRRIPTANAQGALIVGMKYLYEDGQTLSSLFEVGADDMSLLQEWAALDHAAAALDQAVHMVMSTIGATACQADVAAVAARFGSMLLNRWEQPGGPR